MKQIVACSFCLLTFISACLCAFEDVRFDRLRVREGAARDQVNALVQDSRGFLWVGTSVGLFRYDGISFLPHRHNPRDKKTISRNTISHLILDDRNNMWISYDNLQIDRFDPVLGIVLEKYDISGDDPGQDFLSVDYMKHDVDGKTWIATSSGDLFYKENDAKNFQKASLTALQKNYPVLSVLQIQDGPIFVSIENFGIYKLESEHSEAIHIPVSGRKSSDSFVLTKSHDGTIYAGSLDGKIYQYDTAPERFTYLGSLEQKDFEGGELLVNSIVRDQTGTLWCATDDSGVFQFFPETGLSRQNIPEKGDNASLTHYSVNCVYVDDSNNIWIGTQSGLCKFSPQKYLFKKSNINLATKENVTVNAIFQDTEGLVWIGTAGKGLIASDGSGDIQISLRSSFPRTEDSVTSIAQINPSTLILGTTDSGMVLFNKNAREFRQFSSPSYITSIVIDDANTIYFGTTTRGLGSINVDSSGETYWEPRRENVEEVRPFSVQTIYIDSQNNRWVGTDGDGLFRFLYQQNTYQQFNYSSETPGTISSNHITAIEETEDGIIWIGTDNGLNKLDLTANKITRYYESDGLSDNMICGIRAVGKDLWISTYNGICRFNSRSEEMILYDTSDGLQDLEFYPGSHYTGHDGTIYFGGVNGYSILDPGNLLTNELIPRIAITEINHLGERVPNVGILRELVLPYNESAFSVSFAALDFTQPSKNGYAYRLLNLKDEWTYLGNRSTVNFSRIPHGEYILHIKASNNSGIWNEEGIKLPVRIVPPFWMTWQFRVIIVLFIILIVFVIFRVRIAVIEKQKSFLQMEIDERRIAEGRLLAYQERLRSLASKLSIAEELERRRISGALHDDIGHALFLAKVKMTTYKEKEVDQEKLDELEDVIRTIDETLQNTRSMVVEISPPSLYKISLEAAVESLLERFGKKYDIKTILEFQGESSLNDDVAVLLYQAIRELLVNILKHAEASIVKISMKKHDQTLFVTIKDNGKGFDVEHVLNSDESEVGFGLFSIIERMESIKGMCNIDSKQGEGTEIILQAPLQKVEG